MYSTDRPFGTLQLEHLFLTLLTTRCRFLTRALLSSSYCHDTSFSASATSNFAAEDVLVNSFIHRSIRRVKELLVDSKISRQGESTFLMLRNRNFAPHYTAVVEAKVRIDFRKEYCH